MVVPSSPLRSRRIQKEAHVLRDTAIDVPVTGTRRRLQRALCRTRGCTSPRGLVPPSHGRAFISHLHNHQFRLLLKNTNTHENLIIFSFLLLDVGKNCS